MNYINYKSINDLEYTYAVLSGLNGLGAIIDVQVDADKILWQYIVEKYGDFCPMSKYQKVENFKTCIENLWIIKHEKYERMRDIYNKLKESNPLEPYNITLDMTSGSIKGTVETESSGEYSTGYSESSMDSSELNDKSKNTVDYSGKPKTTNTFGKAKTLEFGSVESPDSWDATAATRMRTRRHGNIGNTLFAEIANEEFNLIKHFGIIEIITRDIIDATCLKIFYTL